MALLVTDAHRGAVAQLDDFNASSVTWLVPDAPGSASGVAATPDGVVLADPAQHRIAAWDGTSWTTFGDPGSGVGEFKRPTGVATDAIGHIYVADAGNARIVRVFGIQGASWTEFGQPVKSAADVATPGFFAQPTGVAVAADGSLTVTDLKAGRLVSMQGMDGSGWTTLPLGGPSGVALDEAQAVLGVSILGTRTAAVVDPATGAVEATAPGTLGAPVGVTWLDGELLCCDGFGARLVLLARQAGALEVVAERRLADLGIRSPAGVGVS